ncbi:hypothetical protein GCM10023340_27800 [Nocardioides marinquilinus]|uniref:PH domain-containing protein n=1 Tax=Nocardioides marinquilinus TaxID=1210400 RepID=A0ABP9PQF5_9ACTN
MSDIPLTHRFVADADYRRRVSWASARFALVSRGHLLFYAAIVAFALLDRELTRGWTPLGDAIRGVALVVVVLLAFTVLFTVAVGYRQAYVSARLRYPDDAVLESGFGDDELVLRTPVGETRVAYRDLRKARARGEFVFLATDGLGGQAVFPRALFPDEAVARINAS